MSRREGKRTSQRDFEQLMGGAGTCSDDGKTRYLSKASAKKAIRQLPSRSNRLHPYACGEYWHIGQPPKKLVSGENGRDDLGPTAPRQSHGWRPKDERSGRAS